jgi:hypothetical protein
MKFSFNLKIFPFLIVPLCIVLTPYHVHAQPETNFDVSFNVDYSAAEQLVDYFDWRGSNPEAVAALPGNRLAAATSVLLARTSRPAGDFLQALKNFRNGSQYDNDIYGLLPVKKHIGELRKLLAEAKKHRLDIWSQWETNGRKRSCGALSGTEANRFLPARTTGSR